MKSTLYARFSALFLMGAACLATSAQAEESASNSPFTITGGVDQLTDYRYRGVSQTAGDWAIQGQITVSHTSGFYANLWATNLEDSRVAGSTEWDGGLGWKREITPGLTVDTGLYLFFFPNGKEGHADIYEPFFSVTSNIGPVSATARAHYSWKQESLGGDDNIYLATELSTAIPKTPVTVTAHLGYSDGALSPNVQTEKSLKGGFDYSLGASYQISDHLSFSATYVGVDGYSIDGRTNDTVVGMLSYYF